MQRFDQHPSAAKAPRANRRRTYLINPAFQWKYTLLMLLGLLVVSSFAGVMLFGSLHQQARARVMNPQMVSLGHNTLTVVLTAGAFSILTVAALAVWGIVLTHRMCGPIFVIGRYLDELAAGRLPTLRPLRRKDEFKELYDALAGAIAGLRADTEIDLRTLSETLALAKTAASDDPAERDSALAALEGRLAELCDRRAAMLCVDGPRCVDPAASVSQPALAATDA